nr:hypothetical protein [Tanacetum cinerariifolium]
MSSTVELSKQYDCKVTTRSRPSMILFIKERLSKSNKRLKLFKDTVFGKYLDLDVEDNDNHLLTYVFQHKRPQLSKSIASNLVFDIVGHTLLFGRLEFSVVTGFACRKLVFPEYMDDGIPPFLRRMFLDKAKNLENKASFGKAAQGKAAKGKAAKGKATKDLRSLIWDDEKWKKSSVEDSIRVSLLYMSEQIFMGQEDKKVWILESFPNSYHWWSKESEVIPRCLAWTRRKGFEKRNYPVLFRLDSNIITHIRPGLKERDENWCRKMYDYVTCKERSEHLNRWMTEMGSLVMMNLKLNKIYVKLESYYKNLEASVEIARKNSNGLSFLTPNAKATSVCDDINEADVAADDNAKATSVHDDVGVPDVATDDNSKDMSVCDDIDEVDATTDDNAKATSVHDDVGVPDAAFDDNAKATSVCDDIDEADAATDANAKAMSVYDDVGVPDAASDDNTKATSVHDNVGVPDAATDDNAKDVFQPHALKKMKKETLLSDCPPVIGNYLKEIHIAQSYKRFQRAKDKNTRPQRSFGLFKSSKEATSLVSLGNGLNVDEKFWQSLVARDATSRGFLNLSVVELWVQLMWHFRPKHADWAIFSSYYCNLPTPYDLEDRIFKDITYPVGWANIETGIHWFLVVLKIRKGVVTFYDTLNDKKPWDKEDRPWWIKFQQLMSKQLWKGMSKHGVFNQKNIHPKGYIITFTSPLKAECSNCMFLAKKIKTLETKIKILEAILEMERHPEKARTTHFPPINRSDFTHDEFVDELAHIISLPEYDCFYFRNLPDPGELISILNSGIRKNLSSTTRVNLPVEDDHSPLLAYVVWIFLAYLTYPVIPPYLHSFGNEDTIFDLGIAINRFYSFKPGLSHRCGTFKKFNTHRSHLNESPMEMLCSTCSPIDQ